MLCPSRRRDCIVFDFDGTLADTFAGIERCVNLTLQHFGLPGVDRQVLRPTIGLSLEVVFRTVIDAALPNSTITDMVVAYRRRYPQEAPALTTLFPGIPALLEAATAQGRTLAIATSKASSNILPMLRALAIDGLFEVVCSDDLVERRKPYPDMVHFIAERTGVAPRRMLVVGDTRYDIEMGAAAGAGTCAVSWGNHSREELLAVGPTYLVDTVPGLADVLDLDREVLS
jgi:HAD superfamily hydrolase (TIGR01509 family)